LHRGLDEPKYGRRDPARPRQQETKMPRWRSLAALLLAALIVLAPSLADARAGGSYRSGGGSSFTSQGSRGSQTYAQPMQRSITPQSPGAGTAAGQPGYGYGASHPFWTGLAGGFFGGWLGSMLFPHWGMGYGGGAGGMIGSLFSWLLIIGLVWFGFRMLRGRFAAVGGPGIGPMPFAGIGGLQPAAGGGSGARGAALAIVEADYQAFEAILKHVQDGWSQGNLAELRRSVTPEMLSYFAEELAENQSQGVVNRVEQVELARGDLREAWDEGRLQYATCALRWRALDYTVRTDRRPEDPGYVVAGDPQHPAEAGETWTFVRSPGGQWLLSAIQQV
jgi:predicted lipid-binding transport protein (Tim44 family)